MSQAQWCWICGGRLSIGTDGDGRETANCQKCRGEIEAMQRELRLLSGPGKAAAAVTVRICQVCTKHPLRAHQRKCDECTAAAVTTRICPLCRQRPLSAHQRKCTECTAAIVQAATEAREAKLAAKRERAMRRPATIRPKASAKRDAVLELGRAHPDWPATRIAEKVGCTAFYAAACIRKSGLTRKRARKADAVLRMLRDHPSWTKAQVATKAGCSLNYVYMLTGPAA